MRPTTAVAVWVGVQCVPLAAAAAGVHLWPHHPDPPESLALAELVAVQVVAAGLLFSTLFAHARAAAVAVAVVLPFDAVASLLAASPTATLAASAAFVVLWISGLSGWARLGRANGIGSGLTVVALTLSLGGALLFYERCEEAATSGLPDPAADAYGPLTAAVNITLGNRPPTSAWGVASVPLLSTIGFFGVAAVRYARRTTPSI